MPELRALLAAAALVAFSPARAAAQLRTQPVDVHWYRPFAGPPAPPPPGPAELVALDCERNVSPPFHATRCLVVDPAALQRRADLLPPLAQCYGAAPALPPRPSAPTVAAILQAFERSPGGADRIAVALPAAARPVLVLVRWHDRGTGMRCTRWTRHCTGIDCNMSGARRFCTDYAPVGTSETLIQWGWVADGAMAFTDAAPYLDTGGRLLRFDPLPAGTADAVAHYAAAVNRAVDAWLAADEGVLHAAIADATSALPDATAATPPAEQTALAAPLDALHRVDGYRGQASLRSPCP